MADVLIVYFSLSGQTEKISKAVENTLREGGHTTHVIRLQTDPRFPFPVAPDFMNDLLKKALLGRWPEPNLRPFSIPPGRRFDAIILGYQAWYLTPSTPILAFLNAPEAAILQTAPVIGLMTCRARHRRATRLFRRQVEARGGRLIEQQVFVDQDPFPSNFIGLGHYLHEGKNPERGLLREVLHPFGVGQRGVLQARRYGTSLARRLSQGPL